MPAINVAKTDTFEIQRQKINNIGTQIFNISAGGSDLATGELKLGDGTKTAPSLAFTSEGTLGLYKPASQEIGFVAAGKDIINYRPDGIYSFQDFYVRKRILLNSGLDIQNEGQNYDPGVYTSVDLTGGSGSNGLIDLVVEAFNGSVTNNGNNYLSGDYSDIPLVTDGSGTGVQVSFSTAAPVIAIGNAGSGYDDNEYGSVEPVSSGTGTGLVVTLTITGGSLASVSVDETGSGHNSSDTFTIDNTTLTFIDEATGLETQSGGAGIQLTISNNVNEVDVATLSFQEKGSGHAVGDNLTTPGSVTKTADLPGAVTGLTTTLSVASANITVSSTTGIVSGMIATQTAGDGAIEGSSVVQSVVNGTTIQLSELPTVDGTATLDFTSDPVDTITVSDASDVINGGIVTGGGYTGVVGGIDYELNTITLDPAPTGGAQSGVTFTIAPPYGSGSAFNFEINAVGVVTTTTLSSQGEGNGYAVGDVLTVNPLTVTQPLEYETTVFAGQLLTVASPINVSVGSVINGYTPPDSEAGTPAEYGDDMLVIAITAGSPGSATGFIAGSATQLDAGAEFGINSSGVFTVATYEPAGRFYIDDGNGSNLQPNYTLYAGNTYYFNQTDGSFSTHPMSFSQHPDGTRNLVENITTTLSVGSTTFTASSTTGILEGMLIAVTDDGPGGVTIGSTVTSIVGSTITMSAPAAADGAATLSFTGAAYTDGVVQGAAGNQITITASTPNPLYYYCPNHDGMGGEHTINLNNPKVFGSNLEILVSSVDIDDIISADINLGIFDAVKLTSETSTIGAADFTTSLVSPLGTIDTLNTTDVIAVTGGNLNLSSAADIILQAVDVKLGTGIKLNSALNLIETTGEIKTTTKLNVNDRLSIVDNNISTTSLDDILLTPGLGKVAKVDTSTAFTIPVGTTNDRPGVLDVESGQIRFNTDTNQYEGYSSTAGAWNSLGGVRDLDGNTYILAEEFIGANDNTLYFVNDAVTTMKLDRNFLDFFTTKDIKSTRIGAPENRNWNTNTPVTQGEFLKYGLNLFEVITAGVTGTSGNEPTNTTGNNFNNGSAVLKYNSLAVAPIDFNEVEIVRIGTSNPIPLEINGDLKLFNNTISTNVNDMVFQPNSGQKVKVNANTSLVVPVGDSNSRGNAEQGSIRYNTSDLTYEGYDGSQWGSLGGVKDVDQNTYIIPETAPGANENILYFYNNGLNTLQLTENALEFRDIDTITSLGAGGIKDLLNINANKVTFDNLATTLDNTSADSTFLFCTKQNFDLGLSAGLTTDTLVRLTDDGDVFFNLGFGTGVYNGLKIIDSELSAFELQKFAVRTEQSNLVKDTIDQGATVLYNPAVEASAKVTLTAHNKTSGNKEFLEFAVIDNGTDISYTEYNNLKTGQEIVSVEFDFDANSDVRITYTLDTNLNTGNQVDVTVVNQVTKR
jgi:hypothetical protein